ncbi:MAG: GDSL-type esterase/lipase family protein [Geminicoccaceae bacterium]
MAPAPRICFFGDSLVNGTGDDACLGWVGRACVAARHAGCDLTCYNLGIRRDTSADIHARWRTEAAARLKPEHDGRLVFSFGVNDCAVGEDGTPRRVPEAASLVNAEAILVEAKAWLPTLMVGVLPIKDAVVDARASALGEQYQRLCARLDVPYLPVFALAAGSAVWAREVAAGDGAHPNAGGYALVAKAVSAWPAWRAFIGL